MSQPQQDVSPGRVLRKPSVDLSSPAGSSVTTSAKKFLLEGGLLPTLTLVAVVCVGVLEPQFLSLGNLENLLRQASFLVLVAIAQMMVLLTSELDMSVGSNIALTSVVAATVMTSPGYGDGTAVVLGICAGLAVGVAFGLLNGLIVARFNVPSFIITIATTSIGFGFALMISGGAPIAGLPRSFLETIGIGRVFGIPVPVLVAAITIAVVYGLLYWTKFGRYLYATGGQREAARLAGIPVFRTRVIAFVLTGFLTALAGVLLTARVNSGEASLGTEYVLLSIAAAVLGGTSFTGGRGRLSLVVGGALLLTIMSNGMNLLRIESYTQQVVLGTLLVTAVVIDHWRRRS
jgi:ribose/xylose/arabinose/galactoside ABC-type transport system permease subunit